MSIKNKLWYKLEIKVAEILGLKRIGFSGGVWPKKEDNENIDIIAQCKATESKQITIKGQALTDVFKRSVIQHKIPLFIFHVESIKYERAKTWVAIPLEDFDDFNIITKLKEE